MRLLIFSLVIVIYPVVSLTPSEQIDRLDVTVYKIFEGPKPDDGETLMNCVNIFISIVNETLNRLNVTKKIDQDCEAVREQAYPDFLLYELNDKNLSKLKNILKWNAEEVGKFNVLMKTANDLWFEFLKLHLFFATGEKPPQ